uniref:RNA polymerase Rpb7-like N-terminal domain-containing protein n=1 Tax=Lotharella oceanica TaxID=641309 RepID=A0A7S2THG5_9EUKA|mmetsp:Transcript_14432/g.27398  ORF Transcript_14432/g.27398 Transcript_14432/m.27398 type:complete len:171 (+) Transcript_14432:82-594(+)
MFFWLNRFDKVDVPPICFGKGISEKIQDKLREKVEGKCTGRYGYTILVARVVKIHPGRLDVVTGHAHFGVDYQAIVFKPFKNEVLPTEVSLVTEQGFWCQAGPLEIFVGTEGIPKDYIFNPTDKLYSSEDEDKLIRKGSACRIRILGMTVDADKFKVVGTMKGPYLGPDQ